MPIDVAPVHVAGNAYLGRMSNLNGTSIQRLAASGFAQVIIICSADNVSFPFSPNVFLRNTSRFTRSYNPMNIAHLLRRATQYSHEALR